MGGAVSLPTVTMIQKEQAAIGHEFVFLGAPTQCQECRVKGACLNQSGGRRYRVVKLRDVMHDCLLSGDSVRVVEVEPAAPPTSIEVNAAREGSIVMYQPRMCVELGCEHFGLCRPGGLEGGTKVQILEVGQRLSCQSGHDLVAVKVAYTPD